MSREDIERWNTRYADVERGERRSEFRADALLEEHAALFDGVGHALDLACGLGANALWLADRGYETTAIDGADVGLGLLGLEADRRDLTINTQQIDLDGWIAGNEYRQRFAVITVFRFLDRQLFPQIRSCLAPDGLLVYQTFNRNHLEHRPGFNPDYVLAMNELIDAFGDLEVIVNDQTGTSTRYIGRVPAWT